MKTKNNCLRLAVLGLAVVISAPVLRADTVTWDRQAFGQQVNTCIGLITWPNNNNWSQDLDQECCDVNCDNGSYVAEPSNWTTAGYPNSSTVDVILGDMGAPGTNLDKAIPNALVHSLTILPVGSLNIEAGSGITVNSLVDLQTDTGDRSLTEGGGGGFAGSITLSAGSTMLKSTGTGAYTIQDVHIDATNATFQVNAGTLVFNTDGSSNFTNCNFTLSTGAVLNLGTDPARIEHFNGTFLGNGGGTLRLSGTELQASTNTVFNMPGNMFQWTGGIIDSGSTRTFTNAGKITIAGPVSLSGSGTSFINNKTVVQTGTGTLNMPQGTGIANTATGTYEIRNDLSITGGSSTFDNSGLLRKSAGTGVVDIFAADGTLNFNHLGGTVQVDTGTVRFGSGTSTGATFVIAPGAAVELTSSVGSTVYTGTYTGSGGGTVRLTQGVLHSANPSATINFPEDMFQWSGGEISAASYPFNNDGFITLAGDVAIEGGLFTNNGTIKGNGSFNLNTVNNNGTIAPGDPLGEIDFGWILTLNSTSNLAFDLGGTAQGVTYDFLSLSPSTQTTLGGNLSLTLVNGFVPQATDTFTIMSSSTALAGAFANVANGQRLNTTDGAGSFVVSYGSAKLNDDATAANEVVLSDFQVNATVTAAPTRIREGQSATYTVSLGATASQNVKVNFAMSGTATLGTDYTLTGAQISGNRGKVTIAAGQSSATVTLTAISDGITESSETAIMTLSSGSGYAVGNPKKATVRISDP